ncbi:hypothetical protein BY996DRAFT_4645365 [Phakopsora pachyrhizi]|nr:hypothetical protein BY996DRAFT_4645365 [Phakopsora pachyrhizi]
MSSWSSLSSIDKQAFYSILDEYFESRPQLFQSDRSNLSTSNDGPTQNPTRMISNLLSSHSSRQPSNQQSASSNPSGIDPQSTLKTLGVVSNFINQSNSSNNNTSNQTQQPSKVHSLATTFNQHPSNSKQTPNGLISSQKFFGGFVSQSEKDAMSAKPRGILADAAASSQPSSSSLTSNGNSKSFLPPPSRNNPPAVKRNVKPQSIDHEEHEEAEELVEAIYDYNGTSPEDLSFKEHQIIKVTEHISDDWWNGQIGKGPIGMFPSSYVKPI